MDKYQGARTSARDYTEFLKTIITQVKTKPELHLLDFEMDLYRAYEILIELLEHEIYTNTKASEDLKSKLYLRII